MQQVTDNTTKNCKDRRNGNQNGQWRSRVYFSNVISFSWTWRRCGIVGHFRSSKKLSRTVAGTSSQPDSKLSIVGHPKTDSGKT